MRDPLPPGEKSGPSSSADPGTGPGGDDRTIVQGSASGEIRFSAGELRRALGIPDDEKMGNYRGVRPIGLGGVGAVFSGNEPGTDREVAIKILRPQYKYSRERIEAFIREARATAQIDHPNVVPVYRLGVFDDEGVFFSMKRVRGETLREVVRKLSENHKGYARRYTLRRLVNIFLAACNGVSFANRNGILHGDLKPGNIMIGEFGEVLVMDWGMARYRPELDTMSERRKVHLGAAEGSAPDEKKESCAEPPIGGTPVFMAPEHLTGAEKKLTETSEVYALGTILYSILTWRAAPYAFEGLPQEKVVRQVIAGRFTPPRKAAPAKQPVPRELEAICCKAMSRNPSRRYAHVSDVVDEIQNYLDGYPVRAYSPSPVYRWGKWLSRHPIVPGTLAALIIGVGGFGVYTQLKAEREMAAHFRIAEYNASSAFEYAVRVRRCFRRLKNDGGLGYTDRFSLYRDVNKYTALASNAGALALSSLSLLPRGSDRSPRVVLAREIFRNVLTLYRETGDDQQLLEAMEDCRKRWGALYIEVLKNDPELLRLVRLAEARRGSLRAELPRKAGWRMEIFSAGGAGTDKPKAPGAEVPLAAGACVVRFTDGKNEFFFPVQIQSGRSTELAPGFPREIPPDLCYVGRGEVPVRDLVHFGPGGSVAPFLISRNEVSLGAYLEFLRSLPPREQARHIPRGTARNAAPDRLARPVTGISAGSAEAYCRWLGKKRNMKIRLPELREWQKAAFRFADAGHPALPGAPGKRGVSVFGMADAPEGIRELLLDRQGEARQVVGGSFPAGSPADPRMIQYTVSGDRDIGFRYVAELPPSAFLQP
ncbi:MAG: protein kinase [Lentisphaeria bacterium]|nr:protein kinase [Lentisphaeria bacterium]